MDHQKYSRIVWLDRRIREGAKPTREAIMEEFGVSRSTALETVRFLRDSLNAPLRYGRKRGYYYSDPTYGLPQAFLTEGEVLAVVLLRNIAEGYVGTALEATLNQALAKLVPSLPESVIVDLNAISVHAPPAARVSDTLLADILRAIRERRLMRILHYSPARDEELERTVEPHYLLHSAGDWQLAAFDRSVDDVRTFALRRVRRHEVLAETFTPRSGLDARRDTAFSLYTEHGGEPYEVVLRFDPLLAPWMRDRRFHASQTSEALPDGSLEVRFRTSGHYDVLRLALSYGRRVEVLAPRWLRDEVADELTHAATIYHRGDKP